MKLLPYFFLALVIFSCERPKCINHNPVFESHPVESREYQAELINQLQSSDPQGLTFWLEGFEEKAGKNYLRVQIQGGSLCAIGIFRADEATGIASLIEKKGMGYLGAKLKGFEYMLGPADGADQELILKNVQTIVD